MNENMEGGTAVAEAPVAPKKAKKKTVAKKGKAKGKAKTAAKGSGAPRPRQIYSLAAGVKTDEYDAKTHPGSIVHALRKITSGTRQEVFDEINKQGKLVFEQGKSGEGKSKMTIGAAIGYALWSLKKEGVLKTKAAPKASDKKAAA
jgi:hypothetical protein